MKTMKMKILAIGVSLVVSTTAFAEVKNFFVNGVGNTIEDARESSRYIRDISNIGHVKALINTTKGAPLDFIEAGKMMLYIDDFYGNGGVDSEQELVDLIVDYLESGVYQQTINEIERLADKYKEIKKLDPGEEKDFLNDIVGIIDGEYSAMKTTAFVLKYGIVEAYGYSSSIGLVPNYKKIIFALGENAFIDGLKLLPDSLADIDLNQMYLDLNIISSGVKYNFIAHSQGNLFANRLIKLMNNNGISNGQIKLLSVATPDRYVYNNGKYINLKEDLVADTFTGLPKFGSYYKSNYSNSFWNSLDIVKARGKPLVATLITPVVKKANIAAKNYSSSRDATGHGFIETYLGYNNGSRLFIKNNFIANYNALSGQGSATLPSNISISKPRLEQLSVPAGGTAKLTTTKKYIGGNRTSSSIGGVQICYSITEYKEWQNFRRSIVRTEVNIGSDNRTDVSVASIKIPSSLPRGIYYIAVKINCDGKISESKTHDNYLYVTLNVTSNSGNTSVPTTELYEVVNFQLDNNRKTAKPGDRVLGSLKYCYNGNLTRPKWTRVSYYLSSNSTLDGKAINRGFNGSTEDGVAIGSRNRCRSITSSDDNRGFIIPDNTVEGKLYYIIAVPNDESGTSIDQKYKGRPRSDVESIPIYISTNDRLSTGGNVEDSLVTLSGASIDDSSLKVGDSTTVRVTVHYSSGEYDRDSLGRVHVGYYLSRNRTWDENDILLDYDSSSIGSDDLEDSERESIVIPDDIVLNSSSERWYIIFRSNCRNNPSVMNNDEKSIPITIRRARSGSSSGSSNSSGSSGSSGSSSGTSTTEKNYYVKNLSVESSGQIGATVDISLNYSYSENNTVPVPTVIHYFLSRTSDKSGSFRFLGWNNSRDDNGDFLTYSNRTIHISRKLALPSDIDPGNYYIIAIADGNNVVDEGSGEGDFKAHPITISPATGENFYIYNLRGVETSINAGSDLILNFDYRYSGETQNPAYTTVKYFLSKTEQLGNDKIYLGWDTGNNGGAKISKANPFRRLTDRTLTIHSWIEPGDYYLHVVPDADSASAEGVNENDTVVVPLRVD